MSNAAATLSPEFRRGTSRTRRKSCLAHRALQCDVSWGRRPGLIFFPEPIVRLFTKDPAVSRWAQPACVSSATAPRLRLFYVMMQASTARRHDHSHIVNFSASGIQIPLAYWLAIPLKMHSNGVFFSIAIAEAPWPRQVQCYSSRGAGKKQKI